MSDILFHKILSFRERQTPIRLGDYPSDSNNSRKLRDALVLWGSTLFDLADLPVTDVSHGSQLLQWLDHVETCDLLLLEHLCKAVCNDLNNGHYMNAYQVINDFKGRWNQASITAGHFLVPLKWITLEENGISPFTFAFFTCLFTTPFKVNVSLPLQEILERDYVELEVQMNDWEFPSHVVSGLNEIMREWLIEYKPVLVPRHGPGGVADFGRIPSYEKTMRLTPDLRLSYVLRRFNDIFMLESNGDKLERCSSVVFVPKSIKTYRTICMEPTVLQYVQQGISGSLADYFHDQRFFPIKLSDQDRSRQWARKGSKDQSLATIDLTSASDTIHIDLVKGVFKGTAVYPLLIASRSEFARLPSGEAIALKKFAPMGSACCFPIESLLFAAVVEYCVRSSSLPRIKRNSYVVYGDDLIVPDAIAPLVLETLASLHFLVNTSKSFFGNASHFRESCGGEFYRGYDVTPFRLPRNFPGLSVSGITDTATLVDMANTCHDRRLKLTRRIILRSLQNSRVLIPFSFSGEIGIKTDNPTNFHLPRERRLNKGYGSEVGVVHHVVSTKNRIASRRVIAAEAEPLLSGMVDDYKRWHDWHRYALTFPDRELGYTSPQERPIVEMKKVITPLARLRE